MKMRRRTISLIVPFLVFALTLSFVTILPATSQNTSQIVGKLLELRGELDGQKALQNKVTAVIHQVEAGAFNGAINKLENDVKKAISARVQNPQHLLDLVDEIILLLQGKVPDFTMAADRKSVV